MKVMEFGETLLQTWGITKIFTLEGEGLVNGLDLREKRWWPSNGWNRQVDDLGSFKDVVWQHVEALPHAIESFCTLANF
jgi:hypothetical protein